MIELFDCNKKTIDKIDGYENLKVESILESGDKLLSFSIKKENILYEKVSEEGYVRFNQEEYVIKEKKYLNDNYTHILCQFNLEELESIVIKQFNNNRSNLTDTMNKILKDIGWTFEKCEISKLRRVLKIDSNILEIVNKISDVFNVNFKFDNVNRIISVRSDCIEIECDINEIKSLNNISGKNSEYATRLIPTGINGIGIEEKNNGKDYIDNNTYSNKIKTIYWKDSSYTDIDDLKEDAILRLTQLSAPKAVYIIKLNELATITKKEIADFHLGDKIINPIKTGILTIVRLIEYPDDSYKNVAVISNSTLHFENKENKLKEISNLINNAILDDGSINGTAITKIEPSQINDFKKEVLNAANISGILEQINEVNLNKANIADLNAVNANINNLKVKKADIEELEVTNAKVKNIEITGNATINNLKAINADINILKVDKANVEQLHAVDADIKNLKVENADIKNAVVENINATNAKIDNLVTNKADINELHVVNSEIENLKTKELYAINAKIENLKSKKADIEELNATNATIKNLKANELQAINAEITKLHAYKATIDDLTSETAKINSLIANKANINDLNAAVANITELNNSKANIIDLNATNSEIGKLKTNDLKAINADIDILKVDKANITDLAATNADIKVIKGDTADIKTIVNGNISSINVQAGGITSESLTIANGFIKDAMISNLDVSKLRAGNISTNKFKIQSDDGDMEFVGSTQQFKDKDGNVRIQMGKDVSGEFNFIIKGKDGKTTLIDETGVKENAIADGLIKKDMIEDKAVDGKKINIESMVEELNNDNSSLIKSSKVLLDKTGQSLEVAFNSMKTTIEDVSKDVTYDVDIISTNGVVFKHGDIKTTLIAIVYKGTKDVTQEIEDSKFIWTRISNDKPGDSVWNQKYSGGRKKIDVTKDDVLQRATFNCEIKE